MGVALICWGRFSGPDGNVTVPAPSTDPGSPWLWDALATIAHELAPIGFTALQLPPAAKAQGGDGAGCDGYGVFDPRDLGNKNQQGSRNTRYGSLESLRRLAAVAAANGLDTYLDVVLHQRIGANGGAGYYDYLGADGKTQNGRGPMTPNCFRGERPEDDVPNSYYDFSFGDELVYQNCLPPRYTIEDALDFVSWTFQTTGAAGCRLDDVKGTWAPFIRELMTTGVMAEKFAYGEYFDGVGAIQYWVNNDMGRRCLAEDLPIHFAIQQACNNQDAFALEGAGYAAVDPYMAVTAVENPDTDTSPGEQIISSKLLGYAFLLSIEGYPFIFGKDYFPDTFWPGAYGLKPWIDNLIWIHETLANGGTTTRYVDGKVIVLNRTGSPGLLTCLNFDTWNAREITCPTAFGPNVQLHDYTGRHGDIWTDGEGNATFTIPSNAYAGGQSYLCFSRAGIDAPIAPGSRPISQTFFGADDLDTPAAADGLVTVGRFYCQEGTDIKLSGNIQTAGWAPNAQVTIELVREPIGTVIASVVHAAGKDTTWPAPKAPATGWYMLDITGMNLPASGSPFTLTATYTAPKEVLPST